MYDNHYNGRQIGTELGDGDGWNPEIAPPHRRRFKSRQCVCASVWVSCRLAELLCFEHVLSTHTHQTHRRLAALCHPLRPSWERTKRAAEPLSSSVKCHRLPRTVLYITEALSLRCGSVLFRITYYRFFILLFDWFFLSLIGLLTGTTNAHCT